jgi:RNA polymerase sigma-70 factor (ECF subfamily)
MRQDRGTPEELEAVLGRFSASIRASILKFGLEEKGIDPEDVFQDIRLKIIKKIFSAKKIRSPASYINSVVHSTLIDCLRKSRAQEEILQLERLERLRQAEGQNEPRGSDPLARRAIGEAVESLIPSRKKALKMFLLNMTVEEIARSLNWTPIKTRTLIYRGLDDIREKLKKRGIDNDDRP